MPEKGRHKAQAFAYATASRNAYLGSKTSASLRPGTLPVPFATVSTLTLASVTRLGCQVQSFPSRSKTIRTITISPTIPLGPYPQLRLCPHVGNTPTNAKIRMIRRIVPMPICDPFGKRYEMF